MAATITKAKAHDGSRWVQVSIDQAVQRQPDLGPFRCIACGSALRAFRSSTKRTTAHFAHVPGHICVSSSMSPKIGGTMPATKKEKLRFTGKTEEDIETQFSEWQREIAGNVFSIKRYPIERSPIYAQRRKFKHLPVRVPDAFWMLVEYEAKPL
jgi:hypothetical protein